MRSISELTYKCTMRNFDDSWEAYVWCEKEFGGTFVSHSSNTVTGVWMYLSPYAYKFLRKEDFVNFSLRFG